MKQYQIGAVMLAGALGAATAAVANQPPDVVSTDGDGNTAMGGGALLNLTSGASNTAVGSAEILVLMPLAATRFYSGNRKASILEEICNGSGRTASRANAHPGAQAHSLCRASAQHRRFT